MALRKWPIVASETITFDNRSGKQTHFERRDCCNIWQTKRYSLNVSHIINLFKQISTAISLKKKVKLHAGLLRLTDSLAVFLRELLLQNREEVTISEFRLGIAYATPAGKDSLDDFPGFSNPFKSIRTYLCFSAIKFIIAPVLVCFTVIVYRCTWRFLSWENVWETDSFKDFGLDILLEKSRLWNQAGTIMFVF